MSEMPARPRKRERLDRVIEPYLAQFRIIRVDYPLDTTWWWGGATVPVDLWTPTALQSGEEVRAHLLVAGATTPYSSSLSAASGSYHYLSLLLPSTEETCYVFGGIYKTSDDSLVTGDFVRIYTVDRRMYAPYYREGEGYRKGEEGQKA